MFCFTYYYLAVIPRSFRCNSFARDGKSFDSSVGERKSHLIPGAVSRRMKLKLLKDCVFDTTDECHQCALHNLRCVTTKRQRDRYHFNVTADLHFVNNDRC